MAMDFRQKPEFKKGRTGEQLVADILMKQGFWVIPSYDYSGEDGKKPPRISGRDGFLVLPDLDVCSSRARFWAEVKTKAHATKHQKTGVVEHGINAPHFENYKKIQEITRCPVVLFIVEEDTGAVLSGKLNELPDPREYHGDKMAKGGMVYWPRSSFNVVIKGKELANGN